jgi:hypothetical protein
MTFDKYVATSEYFSQHQNERITGIVFGGSNAVYGVSAKSLGDNLNQKWANLSMYGWYGSMALFGEYVKEVASNSSFAEVRTVLISDMRFTTPSVSPEERDGLIRTSTLRLVPRGSVISLLRDDSHFSSEPADPSVFSGSNGDLLKYNYGIYGCISQISPMGPAEKDASIAADWARQEVEIVSRAFPKAKILITIPPVLSPSETHEVRAAWRVTLISALGHVNARVLPAEDLNDPHYFCDRPTHANREGRQILTENLALNIAALEKVSK